MCNGRFYDVVHVSNDIIALNANREKWRWRAKRLPSVGVWHIA